MTEKTLPDPLLQLETLHQLSEISHDKWSYNDPLYRIILVPIKHGLIVAGNLICSHDDYCSQLDILRDLTIDGFTCIIGYVLCSDLVLVYLGYPLIPVDALRETCQRLGVQHDRIPSMNMFEIRIAAGQYLVKRKEQNDQILVK